MHILTKILVVLVSLLVVALVPVAAVSSANQFVFKQQAVEAKSSADKAKAELAVSHDAYNASVAAMQAKVSALEASLRAASMERDKEQQMRADKEVALQRALADLSEAKSDARAFKDNDGIQTKLIDAMRQDVEAARTQFLTAQKSVAELDDRLKRTEAELESVNAANNQLKEQVQRASEEKDRAMAEAQRYAAAQGVAPAAATRAGATSDARLPVVADRSLSATVVNVKREPDSTLAEINAGSRDGVKEGWVMTIADGSSFIGNLRIVTVDVNRAVGIVELEDSAARGEVKSGQRAIARKGE